MRSYQTEQATSRQPKTTRGRVGLIACSLAVLATCSAPGMSLGHDGHEHPPRKVKPAEMYLPSLVPDRIVLTWTGDPATSQAVTWRTSTEVTKPVAEIAVATPNIEFTKVAQTVAGVSTPLKTDINEAHFHSVEFTGLEPRTKYAYRVGDGVNWSEWFHFTTASQSNEPFTFVYFGDAQNDLRSMWSRVIREAYSDASKCRFLLHAGDLINNAEADAEWGEWFGGGGYLNAMIPSIPVPGNHEMAKKDGGSRVLSHHWRPQFTLPQNGPQGLEESCYWVVYQNTLIVGLNSNERQEEQGKWLDELLTKTDYPWVICTFHHPIYSTGKDRDNAALRNLWKPIFDKHHVDLVLTGHDHTYGRTGLETPLVTVGNVPTGVRNVDTQTGTVYVVSVSGPKMYNLQPHPFMKRTAEDTQLYQIIRVEPSKIVYEARTAVGELYDAFTLEKQPGSINRLIEQVPDTPDRRRQPSQPLTDAKAATPPNAPAKSTVAP
jgi:acid phosphatase type 7